MPGTLAHLLGPIPGINDTILDDDDRGLLMTMLKRHLRLDSLDSGFGAAVLRAALLRMAQAQVGLVPGQTVITRSQHYCMCMPCDCD